MVDRVRNKKSSALLFFLLLAWATSAIAFKAETILECESMTKAECSEEARSSVIALMSMQLVTDVQASTTQIERMDGTQIFNWQAKTSSQLPIIGANIQCEHIEEGFLFFNKTSLEKCIATIEPEEAVFQYKNALQNIVERAQTILTSLSQPLTSNELSTLYRLISLAQEFENLYVAFQFFDAQVAANSNESTFSASPSLPFSTESYLKKIQQLEISPTDFADIARTIANGITGQNILVKPVLPVGSNEVTPFSAMLAAQIERQLNQRNVSVSKDKGSADTFITGNYQVNKDGMTLVINEIDTFGSVLYTRVWNLSESMYRHFQTQPQHLDFDRLLREGLIQSDEFNVMLQTNKGNRGVIFTEGEQAKLLVKMSRSGYFYVVGHTFHDMEYRNVHKSYLLEISHEDGKYAFERYVGPEDVNKWLVLGEYYVCPEFGQESLQVFASDKSFVQSGSLPNVKFDGVYYTIAGDAISAIRNTRGLVRMKSNVKGQGSKESEHVVAEGILMFQTSKSSDESFKSLCE